MVALRTVRMSLLAQLFQCGSDLRSHKLGRSWFGQGFQIGFQPLRLLTKFPPKSRWSPSI